jgi:hypothetical protein
MKLTKLAAALAAAPDSNGEVTAAYYPFLGTWTVRAAGGFAASNKKLGKAVATCYRQFQTIQSFRGDN